MGAMLQVKKPKQTKTHKTHTQKTQQDYSAVVVPL